MFTYIHWKKNLIYDPRNPSQILRIFLLTLEIYINHLLFHNHFSYPQNMVITQSLSNLPPATNDSVNNLRIYITLKSLAKQCWKALRAVRVAVYHGLVAFFKSSATWRLPPFPTNLLASTDSYLENVSGHSGLTLPESSF